MRENLLTVEPSVLPILLLGSLGDIRTATRLEKLAFLSDKNTFAKKPHYTDWKPYYYGPYSEQLMKDVEYYESKNIIKKRTNIDAFANTVKVYSLTIKGRKEFSEILNDYDKEQFEIKELLKEYQLHKTNNKLLKFVYVNYSEYTKHSKIKEDVLNRG